MKERKTIEDVVKRCKETHGVRYDYSKSSFIKYKINIICKKHGEFIQDYNSHIRGQGCRKCFFEKFLINKIKSNEQYIIDVKKVHGDKYDYSKVEYKNQQSFITIICPCHGEFVQKASCHLGGSNCLKCSGYFVSDTNSFIEKSKEIHGNKYDYTSTIYIDTRTKVEIICKIHGKFDVIANHHLHGRGGCKQCGFINLLKSTTKSQDNYIKECIEVHGNQYDYSRVNYVNAKTNVEIICKKHGPFLKNPQSHLNGSGCLKCKASKGERKIVNFLNKNNINYTIQKTYDGCRNPKTNYKLRYDFYIPFINTLIEYDGIQHFERSSVYKHIITEEEFEDTKFRDLVKTNYALNNNIKLIRIPYTEIRNIDKILTNEILTSYH